MLSKYSEKGKVALEEPGGHVQVTHSHPANNTESNFKTTDNSQPTVDGINTTSHRTENANEDRRNLPNASSEAGEVTSGVSTDDPPVGATERLQPIGASDTSMIIEDQDMGEHYFIVGCHHLSLLRH